MAAAERLASQLEETNIGIGGAVEDSEEQIIAAIEERVRQVEARLAIPPTYVPEPQPLIGREEHLEKLHGILTAPRTMAALVGRGGSGKSHCAKMFARQWSDQDPRRWAYWLNAETETELRQSYT